MGKAIENFLKILPLLGIGLFALAGCDAPNAIDLTNLTGGPIYGKTVWSQANGKVLDENATTLIRLKANESTTISALEMGDKLTLTVDGAIQLKKTWPYSEIPDDIKHDPLGGHHAVLNVFANKTIFRNQSYFEKLAGSPFAQAQACCCYIVPMVLFIVLLSSISPKRKSWWQKSRRD